MNLNDLGNEVHATACEKGFYDHQDVWADEEGFGKNPSLAAEKLCLLHSEISEILEALRDGDEEHEVEECADVLIRLVDYCCWRSFDLDGAVEAKMAKNRDRPAMHGRRF